MLTFQNADQLALAYLPNRVDDAGSPIVAVVNPTSLLRPSIPSGETVLAVFCAAAVGRRLITFAEITGFLEDRDTSWPDLGVDWEDTLGALDACAIDGEIDVMYLRDSSRYMIDTVRTTPKSSISYVDADRNVIGTLTPAIRAQALDQLINRVDTFESGSGRLRSMVQFAS
jgi:hypothetical protein